MLEICSKWETLPCFMKYKGGRACPGDTRIYGITSEMKPFCAIYVYHISRWSGMDQSSHAQTVQEGDVEPLRKPVAVRKTGASGGVTGAISGWPHVAGIGRAEKRKLGPCPTVLSALPMAKPGGLGLNQRLGS